MSRRRKAREIALQTLYAAEVAGSDWREALRENVARRKASPDAVEYAERLVSDVTAQREKLDELISNRLENWELRRVSVVDRTILRIALSELINCPVVPTSVIMDEAIEIAQKFSTADAGRFVNGVLDALAKEVRAA